MKRSWHLFFGYEITCCSLNVHYFVQIMSGGIAQQQGILAVGDTVELVNGKSVAGLKTGEISELFRANNSKYR